MHICQQTILRAFEGCHTITSWSFCRSDYTARGKVTNKRPWNGLARRSILILFNYCHTTASPPSRTINLASQAISYGTANVACYVHWHKRLFPNFERRHLHQKSGQYLNKTPFHMHKSTDHKHKKTVKSLLSARR